jgi:hypothetical protein
MNSAIAPQNQGQCFVQQVLMMWVLVGCVSANAQYRVPIYIKKYATVAIPIIIYYIFKRTISG